MATFSVIVSDDQQAQLDDIAAQKQVSRNAVVRWAIDEYLRALFLSRRSIDSTIVHTKDQEVPQTTPTQQLESAGR